MKPRPFTGYAWRGHFAACLRGKSILYVDHLKCGDDMVRVRVTPLPARKKRRAKK